MKSKRTWIIIGGLALIAVIAAAIIMVNSGEEVEMVKADRGTIRSRLRKLVMFNLLMIEKCSPQQQPRYRMYWWKWVIPWLWGRY